MLQKQVGSYRITEKLAQGGMGEVYIAQHELMDREAVVKVLHPRLSHDEEVVQRFLNEARAAASIHHPGIVAIYDLGRDTDGQVYIVMERLHGETLAQRIVRAPIHIDQAMAMARQLASALAAAHARDIVHRDLKPENIFVVADPDVPGGERVKVLDFGVAKLAPSMGGSNLTAQGTIFGTPAYMAPEQCENAATVDNRTDLYAIGCILYEMLCGKPPFGKGGLELLAAHLRDTPEPPSKHDPQIPRNLDETILRLLAKKPADRFQSCDELLQALGGTIPVPRASQPRIARRASTLAFAATIPPVSSTSPSLAPGAPGTPELSQAASTVSPTTFRSASGQVGKRQDRRGRGLLGVAAVVLIGGAAAAAVMLTGQGADEAATPASQAEQSMAPGASPAAGEHEHPKLAAAERALAEMRWEDAIVAAAQLASSAAEDSAEHRRARELQEQARQGQRAGLIYETFSQAAGSGDLRTAVYAFEQFADDSPYRAKAQPLYESLRDTWLEPRLASARKHAQDKRCSRIDPIEQEVKLLFPESMSAMHALQEECRERKSESNRKKKGDASKEPAGQDGQTGEGTPAEGAAEPPESDVAATAAAVALPDRVAQEVIDEQLAAARKQLHQCHAEAKLQGVVVLSFSIKRTGRVLRVTSDKGTEEFNRCAWTALRQATTFPPAKEATEVSYRIGKDASKKTAPKRPAKPVRK